MELQVHSVDEYESASLSLPSMGLSQRLPAPFPKVHKLVQVRLSLAPAGGYKQQDLPAPQHPGLNSADDRLPSTLQSPCRTGAGLSSHSLVQEQGCWGQKPQHPLDSPRRTRGRDHPHHTGP